MALGNYFDRAELLSAYTYGWDLSFLSPPAPRNATFNLPSAAEAESDVDKYVATELAHGALIGPVNPAALPFPISHNPLGTVPKAGSSTRRTIVDCSQAGRGINAYIPSDFHRGSPWKLTLPTTDTIIRSIQRTRSRYPNETILLFKIDFSRFYRWLVLDPHQVRFLAVHWRGKSYLDAYFSFGNRGATLAAQRTSWAVCHIFRTKVPPAPGSTNPGINCSCPSHCLCGSNTADPYIDDCIVSVPASLAEHQFSEFQALARKLGLALSQTTGHISPPAEQCVALGILFDLASNTISLPEEKLGPLLDLLHSWLNKTHATEKELASLAGKLLFASRVVRPGRTFLNRALATKRQAAAAGGTIILDAGFFADISWWSNSLRSSNGISFLESRHEVEVSLDASSAGWYGNIPGLAGFNHSTSEFWACGAPSHIQDFHIADLELFCHIIAARVWGCQWKDVHVLGHTDNEPTFYLLKNGRSRIDLRLRMARCFSSLQVSAGFLWETAWISTKLNELPDYLSRSGDPVFRKKFAEACAIRGIVPTQIPVNPDWLELDTVL